MALSYIISGSIADSAYFQGWPSIFYVTGMEINIFHKIMDRVAYRRDGSVAVRILLLTRAERGCKFHAPI